MVMISAAAITTQLRAPEVPGAGWLAAVAFTLATAVCLTVLLGAGVFPTEGRTIVPLAGLVIGNSLSATVIASRRIVGELRDHSLEVEARLALGQPSQVAAYPYMKLALRTSLIPQIETTKAVGLIALPGAMVGLLLVGLAPVAWLFAVSTASVPFVAVLAVAIWLTALSFVARYVGKLKANALFQRQAGIKLWLVILTLVTLQMATCMRPMLTKPEKGWWTVEKKFFVTHFGDTFEGKK